MQNNDLIAALGWALDEARHRADCSQFISEVKELDKHIRTIRAHISDLRAGNLVRREDVVKTARTEALRIEECAYGVSDIYRAVGMRDFADAIAAGAHEGGGDE